MTSEHVLNSIRAILVTEIHLVIDHGESPRPPNSLLMSEEVTKSVLEEAIRLLDNTAPDCPRLIMIVMKQQPDEPFFFSRRDCPTVDSILDRLAEH